MGLASLFFNNINLTLGANLDRDSQVLEELRSIVLREQIEFLFVVIRESCRFHQ